MKSIFNFSSRGGSAFGGKFSIFKHSCKGISSLPLILIISGLITVFALGAVFLVFLVNNVNLGERASMEALAVARSGIYDGILKVVRNKNCPDVNCQSNYSVTLDNHTAAITICKDFCEGVGRHVVTSSAQVLASRRVLKAVLETNPVTGEVLIESITEISL